MSETQTDDSTLGPERTPTDEWKRDVALLLAIGVPVSALSYYMGWTPLGGAVMAPLGGIATYVAVELYYPGLTFKELVE